MMRRTVKITTFASLLAVGMIFLLLPMTAQAAGETELDISQGSITISATGASGGGLATPETALNPAGYIITGSTATNTVTVQTSTSVTLRNLNIDVSAISDACAFSIESYAAVSLLLEGSNTLKSSGYQAGLLVFYDASIDIGGNGSLDAHGVDNAAGIGGGFTMMNGPITINSGKITATGSLSSAGIGGGRYGDGGKIVINGGTIIATGSEDNYGSCGAGIGGGYSGSGGTVIINGGSIYATGGGHGAADIGGGSDSSHQGTLKNSGGENLYLTTVQLSGTADGTAVLSLTNYMGDVRGLVDVICDDAGKIYLYLPWRTVNTQVLATTGAYEGLAVTEFSSDAYTFSIPTNPEDGREIELRNNGSIIQWRYVGEGDDAWRDLVTLASLTGADGQDGRKIELRVADGYIQWRYVGDTDWNSIVALSAITGPQGADGADGVDGTNGSDGANGNDGADGLNGKNGSNSNSIAGIAKTAEDGSIDIYTVSFTDGTSTTFTVTNGKDGVGVASAAFNENGEMIIILTDGKQINLGTLPASVGSVPASGMASGGNGSTGGGMSTAVPIALGAAALLSAQLWWLIPLLKKIMAAR